MAINGDILGRADLGGNVVDILDSGLLDIGALAIHRECSLPVIAVAIFVYILDVDRNLIPDHAGYGFLAFPHHVPRFVDAAIPRQVLDIKPPIDLWIIGIDTGISYSDAGIFIQHRKNAHLGKRLDIEYTRGKTEH